MFSIKTSERAETHRDRTGRETATDVTSRKIWELENRWMGGNWLSTPEKAESRVSAGRMSFLAWKVLGIESTEGGHR